MVEVKICGLSTTQSVETAIDAGARFVGFVFYGPSPRNISTERAAELAKLARGRSKIVALVVDAPNDELQSINDIVSPDYFQAHGSESPDRILSMTSLTAKPVIKAIKVGGAADVLQAQSYQGKSHFILFDAKAPDWRVGALPGGNGVAFDWTLLGQSHGFMLSGGLNPENVVGAIKLTRAPMVDVSSGVESAPGIKDLNLIRKFIERAKSAS